MENKSRGLVRVFYNGSHSCKVEETLLREEAPPEHKSERKGNI